MTTTTRETEIVVDPDVPQVTIIREFDAPPEKVFRAHADPELFVQWIGPDSLDDTVVDRWDCRTGGEYRFANRRGDDEFWFRGCFHEVRPEERIVQTFTYEDAPEGVALETMTFEDLGDGRTRLVGRSLVDSFEGRDAMIASGMETGIQEGYRKLDAILTTL